MTAITNTNFTVDGYGHDNTPIAPISKHVISINCEIATVELAVDRVINPNAIDMDLLIDEATNKFKASLIDTLEKTKKKLISKYVPVATGELRDIRPYITDASYMYGLDLIVDGLRIGYLYIKDCGIYFNDEELLIDDHVDVVVRNAMRSEEDEHVTKDVEYYDHLIDRAVEGFNVILEKNFTTTDDSDFTAVNKCPEAARFFVLTYLMDRSDSFDKMFGGYYRNLWTISKYGDLRRVARQTDSHHVELHGYVPPSEGCHIAYRYKVDEIGKVLVFSKTATDNDDEIIIQTFLGDIVMEGDSIKYYNKNGDIRVLYAFLDEDLDTIRAEYVYPIVISTLADIIGLLTEPLMNSLGRCDDLIIRWINHQIIKLHDAKSQKGRDKKSD